MNAPATGTVRRWGFRLLLVLSILGALVLYGGPALFELRGQTLFVLTGGSMGDTYPAGSAVVAENVTPDQLRVGQVITFKETLAGKYVTHRIVALKTLPRTKDDGTVVLDAAGRPISDHYVQTKGDGNQTPDPNLTPVEQVRYLVIDGYPGLGSWLIWSRTVAGKVLLFGPAFLLLLMAELWSWRPGGTGSTGLLGRFRHPSRDQDVAITSA